MKKVFIYVGHANWGKSFALKKITNDSSHQKTVIIKSKWIWVKKMSNDDDASGLLSFVKDIKNRWYDNFIMAYCPNHEHDQGAKDILNNLKLSFELYFFVQENNYMDPTQSIPEREIEYLRQLGKVKVLSGKHEDVHRAGEFKKFIEEYI